MPVKSFSASLLNMLSVYDLSVVAKDFLIINFCRRAGQRFFFLRELSIKIYTKSWSTMRSFKERWCSLGTAAWVLCRWLEVANCPAGSGAQWQFCSMGGMWIPPELKNALSWCCFGKSPGVCALAKVLRAPGCEAPSCKASNFTALQVLGVFQVPAHRAWILAAPRWRPGSLLPRQKILFWTSKPVLGPFLLFRF